MKGKATLLLHATEAGYGGKVIQVTQIVLPKDCSCEDIEKGMEVGKKIAWMWESGERDKEAIQRKKDALTAEEFFWSRPPAAW